MKEELRIFFCTFSTKLFKIVIKITNILSEFEDKKIDKNIDEQYYRVLNQIWAHFLHVRYIRQLLGIKEKM